VTRLLGPFLIYVVMFLAWTGVGLFMLLAPGRFGNFLHLNVGVFPEVQKADWGKKLFVRLVGAGLLAFAAHFALGVADLIRQSRLPS
jgi:hypothetical protein